MPLARKMEMFHLKARVDSNKFFSKPAKRAYSYLEEVVAAGAPPTCKLQRLVEPLFCTMAYQ